MRDIEGGRERGKKVRRIKEGRGEGKEDKKN